MLSLRELEMSLVTNLNKRLAIVVLISLGLLSACKQKSSSNPAAPSSDQGTTQPAAQAIVGLINIWWPTADFPFLKGSLPQPFKAQLKHNEVDIALNQYKMYWQVDGGQLNIMQDSNDGWPHKEAIVNVMNWSWNSNLKYRVTFVAKDNSGNLITTKDVVITVDNR